MLAVGISLAHPLMFLPVLSASNPYRMSWRNQVDFGGRRQLVG